MHTKLPMFRTLAIVFGTKILHQSYLSHISAFSNSRSAVGGKIHSGVRFSQRLALFECILEWFQLFCLIPAISATTTESCDSVTATLLEQLINILRGPHVPHNGFPPGHSPLRRDL